MAPNRNTLSSLGETEMEILNIIWRLGRNSVAEVRTAMDRPVAHNTVQTIMRKLSRKGYLSAELVGKTHYYTTAQSEVKVKRGILKGLVSSVFEGSHLDLVRTMAQDESFSEAELVELRTLIDQLSERGEAS
jgi:BlaI family penicillinase repressor